MGGKVLVWALRAIGAIMFALIVGITGNLLTPVAEQHSVLAEDLLHSTWLQLGLFIVALLVWAALYLRLRAVEPHYEPIFGTVEDGDRRDESREVRVPFNPYNDIIEKVMFVNLSALWKAPRSPYIEITLDVRQTSDYPIELTGVNGTLYCEDSDCQLPPRLMNAPIDLQPRGERFQRLVIRQPITVDMQQDFIGQVTELNLHDSEDQVRFSLAGMKWIGTVTLPEGAKRLDRTVSNDTFRVQGPVTEADASELLWPLERIFVSQLQYSLDGRRRNAALATGGPSYSPPPQEPEPVDEQLVILCNSFLTPAFDSLRNVLSEVFAECFQGGWPGLSARYFRDFAFEPLEHNSAAQLRASINGDRGELEGAFFSSMEAYLRGVAFVRHSAHLGFFADWESIGDWVAKDDDLKNQIKVLSGGLKRESLKNFLNFEWERLAMPHEVLEMASIKRGESS